MCASAEAFYQMLNLLQGFAPVQTQESIRDVGGSVACHQCYVRFWRDHAGSPGTPSAGPPAATSRQTKIRLRCPLRPAVGAPAGGGELCFALMLRQYPLEDNTDTTPLEAQAVLLGLLVEGRGQACVPSSSSLARDKICA